MSLKNILEQSEMEIYSGRITKVSKDSIYVDSDCSRGKSGGEIPRTALLSDNFKKKDPVILLFRTHLALFSEVYHGKTGEPIYIEPQP